MGNLVTKITTNNVQLNESNASELTVYEVSINKRKFYKFIFKFCALSFILCFIAIKQVKKEEKSPAQTQTKNGLFKNILSIDPRSPSLFITRTPITIFQRGSGSKFTHQELNESLNLNETNESVDLDILTAAEQESLNSNKDLTEAVNDDNKDNKDNEKIEEQGEKAEKLVEDNLIKKITDKLVSTKLNENSENKKSSPSELPKKKLKEKNLIFEDDHENLDRFSTPPKKMATTSENDRTPLSCVVNTRRNVIKTSTPKSSKIPVARERASANRIPRKI